MQKQLRKIYWHFLQPNILATIIRHPAISTKEIQIFEVLTKIALLKLSFLILATLHCFYCDKDGHKHREANQGPWRCPDYLSKKAPCQSWQKYQSDRGFNPNPFAVLNDTSDKREVALSRDIAFKGNTRWHYNLITFLDLGGCENVVNASFARNVLRLPIKEDDSSASKFKTYNSQ